MPNRTPAQLQLQQLLSRAARNPALLQRLIDRSLTRADKVALGLRERTRGDYLKMQKAAKERQK